VLHCLCPFLYVKVGSKINLTRREVLEKTVNVAIDPGCYAINFYPVAGGEEDDFIQTCPQLEAAAKAPQTGGMHRQLFAQFHWRGLVA
jgi:hypothetical protein